MGRMPVTPEQVSSWLTEHAPGAPCPLCRQAGDWHTGLEMAIGAGMATGHVVPLVCKQCGHVELLSTRAMGV
jgi:hypothetical protein